MFDRFRMDLDLLLKAFLIKMTIKGRSPTLRHLPRTHRVDLDWLFERLKDDPGIFMRFVETKEQIADIFTKGQFTKPQFDSLVQSMMLAPSQMFVANDTKGIADTAQPFPARTLISVSYSSPLLHPSACFSMATGDRGFL